MLRLSGRNTQKAVNAGGEGEREGEREIEGKTDRECEGERGERGQCRWPG